MVDSAAESIASSSCYVPRFPLEVTELILSKCDGTTLLDAKAGDKLCAHIVDTRTDWRQRCLLEIPDRLREELVFEMHPKHWFVDDINWGNVYKTWVKWNRFTPAKVERVGEPPYSIRCVEVSGGVAFVGHAEGVISYNIESKRSIVIFHGITVNSMELFTHPGAPMDDHEILEGCVHDSLDLYLPRFHYVIDLRKKYHYSRTYRPERENVLTKYHKNAILHLFESYRTSHLKLELDGKLEDDFIPSKINSANGVCLYDNTISYFVKDLPLVVEVLNFDLDTVIAGEDADIDSKPIDCGCGCLRAAAFKLKYWKCGVFFAVSMCNRLYMNSKNSTSYIFLKDKAITAIELYQNFLFLGTDVGYLFQYQIQELKDLLRLDFDSPIRRMDVDDSAIKAIRGYQAGCTPGLAVATQSCIYRVQ